jgi:RNA polymerase sigma-70 factor (ECF subfamily)
MFEEITELSDSLLSEGSGAARCRAPVVIENGEPGRAQESGLITDTTEAFQQEHAIETPQTTDEVAEAEGVSNDKKLIRLALAGDTTAFSELIQRHYSTCLKRASFMLRNRSEAEEEVQNACWKAFERLEQYRGEGTFGAWLSRIVENQCLMRIREEKRFSFLYLDASTDSDIRMELVAQGTNPEDELGEQQVMNLIRREISRIPPLLRNVLLLRDVEQLPMPDVASRLGVSLPAAKSRLMRARNELRQRLTKHCGTKGCATLTRRAKYQQAAFLRAS